MTARHIHWQKWPHLLHVEKKDQTPSVDPINVRIKMENDETNKKLATEDGIVSRRQPFTELGTNQRGNKY